jgi:hypothetical protein
MRRMSVNPTDFEALRIALMDFYNTQAITHVGYVVGLVIAIIPLFNLYISGRFYNYGKFKRLILYLPACTMASLIFYFICRIAFWSWLGTVVLIITPEQIAIANSSTQISGIQTYLLKTYSSYTHSVISPHFWVKLFSGLGGIVPSIIVLSISMLIIPLVYEVYCWKRNPSCIQRL